jgi:hypothetical protein
VLRAALCAGFYPNLAFVQTPERRYHETLQGTMPTPFTPDEVKIWTRRSEEAEGDSRGQRVRMHPSSINAPTGEFSSPYLVFFDKVETSQVFLRDTSTAPPYALLLLAGGGSARGSIGLRVDASRHEIRVGEPGERAWIQFACHPKTACLIRVLRDALDELLLEKVARPELDLLASPVSQSVLRLLRTAGGL